MCVFIILCQIEKQLKAEIESLEQQTARKITINNEPYSVYLRHQWDEYNMKKEKEKQQRVCYILAILTLPYLTFRVGRC